MPCGPVRSRRYVCVFVLPVAAVLFPSLTYAQTPPPPAAPTSPAAPAPPESPGDGKAAEQHFQRAKQLYDEGDFALALVEFQRAYELSPNYRVLYNIGQVNIQLYKYAPARQALEQYLKDGGAEISAQRKTQVDADLKMLRDRTAMLKIVTNTAAEVALDDLPVQNAPFAEPLLVNAGNHKVVVSHSGYQPATRYVTLAGRDNTELKIDLVAIPDTNKVAIDQPKPTTTTKKNYTPAIVGWVATGALAVGAGVVGAMYLNQKSKVDEANVPGFVISRTDADAITSKANSLALTADLLGAAAIVAGAISVYFTVRPPKTEVVTAAKIQLLPGGLRGTF